MDIEEDRKTWKCHSDEIDNLVDDVLMKLASMGTSPMDGMSVDMIYRSFLHWFNSARANKEEPVEIVGGVARVVGMMILELSTKIGERNSDGTRKTRLEWIHGFLEDLVADISENAANLNLSVPPPNMKQ